MISALFEGGPFSIRQMFAAALAWSWAVVAAGAAAPKLAETQRIQAEIDSAAAKGGGRVVITAGEHSCGTLYLKSGVELHLEEGAVLLGGDNSSCYDDAIPDSSVYSYVGAVTNTSTRKAFIFAEGATNIAITGKGVIDCQGPKFFDHNTVLWGCFWAKPPCMRPRMVVFQNCRGIRLEDTTFKDCPVWTIWLRRCADIAISRVRIVAEPKMINSDGIDVDGCRNVRMVDSCVSTGDDCLVLRSIRRGAPAGASVACENVVVSNCVLSTPCQGVRIGCPSDDTIRNAIFRDIVFTGNNAIFANQQPQYLEAGDRGRLSTRDILFENWDIRCQGCPISIVVERDVTLRDFGHMTFKNIRIDSSNPIRVCGNDSTTVKDVTFDGIYGALRSCPPIETNKVSGLVLSNCQFAPVKDPVSKLPFKLGIAGYTYHRKTLDEALSAMSRMDVHYLCIKDTHINYRQGAAAPIEAFKAKCRDSGVECLAAGPLYFCDEPEARKFFEFAKSYGLKTVVVVPFEMREIDGRQFRVESEKALDILEKLVGEFDIRAAIHNHGPDMPNLYPTAEAALKRIAKRDSRIGFCLDIGHERRAGLDPTAFIRKHGSRIYDIHLKNIKIDPVNNYAKEGPRGELDIPGILRALKDVGYRGVCHIEYEKDFNDNLPGVAESVGYYRGIMDML